MFEWLLGAAYYAHGYCLSWNPWLIASQAGADFVIFASFTTIPIAILIYLRRRPGLQLKGLGRFFAAFIFWCGLTHLIEVGTLWFPIYEFQAAVKIVTAAISLTTAVIIFDLIPEALAIPSPRDLQLVNDRLRAEVSAHEATLAELRLVRDQLEARVAERTESLEEAAAHAQSLVREIAHRSGNLMSVISAMARQTARTATTPPALAAQLAGRIEGMGRSQDLLLQNAWRELELRALIRVQLAPFLGTHPLALEGPPIAVAPNAAHTLGMVFYELGTNALKYGSLSHPDGKLTINWRSVGAQGEDEKLIVVWEEFDGPQVSPPERTGWGAQVTNNLAASTLQGEATTEFAPGGLKWTLQVPLPSTNLRVTGAA